MSHNTRKSNKTNIKNTNEIPIIKTVHTSKPKCCVDFYKVYENDNWVQKPIDDILRAQVNVALITAQKILTNTRHLLHEDVIEKIENSMEQFTNPNYHDIPRPPPRKPSAVFKEGVTDDDFEQALKR